MNNKESKIGMSVLMSTEYSLDLHIPHKSKDLKWFFSHMKKEELSFIFENNDSLTNKGEEFVKQHNRNITCKCKSVSSIDYRF